MARPMAGGPPSEVSRQWGAFNVVTAEAKNRNGFLMALVCAAFINRIFAGFNIMQFLRSARSIIPIILTNDDPQSSAPRQILTLAAGVTYSNAQWTHVCPADRYRLILAHEIAIDGSAAGSTVGGTEVSLGVANQLQNQAQIRYQRTGGRTSTENFPIGYSPDWRDGALAAGVQAPAMVSGRSIWDRLLPAGPVAQLSQGLFTEALQPKEQLQLNFTNLNGVAVAGAAPQAVVLHGTFRAVGFDIFLG